MASFPPRPSQAGGQKRGKQVLLRPLSLIPTLRRRRIRRRPQRAWGWGGCLKSRRVGSAEGAPPGSPPARARAPPGSRGGGRGVPTPHPPLHLRGAPSTQGPSDHPPPSCPCSPFCHLVRSTRKESLLSSSLLSREPTGECAADRRLRGKGRATPVAEGKERRRRLFGGEKGAWRKGGGRRGGRGRLGGKKSIRG